jgi:hypothetical protein
MRSVQPKSDSEDGGGRPIGEHRFDGSFPPAKGRQPEGSCVLHFTAEAEAPSLGGSVRGRNDDEEHRRQGITDRVTLPHELFRSYFIVAQSGSWERTDEGGGSGLEDLVKVADEKRLHRCGARPTKEQSRELPRPATYHRRRHSLAA